MKRKAAKQICSMMLACVMAAGCLGGCGKTNTEKKTESGSSESNENVATTTDESETKKLELDGPVTLTILALDEEGQDPDDVYIYKYLEWWLAEQGYEVTLDVTHVSSSDEWKQQLSIGFGTAELPDMGWGYGLSSTQVAIYGAGEHLLLDWTPYLNEDTMPNLVARFEEVPSALQGSICSDGGVYALPTIYDSTVGSTTGSKVCNVEVFLNQTWLDQIGYDTYPTTVDEFLDMAREMKKYEHPEGLETWPICDYGAMLANVLVWLPNGYCCSGGSKYGTSFMVKDGEVVLGCYEEEYRELVTLYNQMYEEGLLHPDFLTFDGTTSNAMISAGQFGVMSSWTEVEDDSSANPYPTDEKFRTSIFVNPLTNDTGIEPIASINSPYVPSTAWVSNDTEYPELCALILDYLYSVEGAVMYAYGPQQGQDPLNVQEGWFWDGKMSYADLGDQTVAVYTYNRMNPYSELFNRRGINQMICDITGKPKPNADWELTDAITGETFIVKDYYDENSLTAWKEHFYVNEEAKWAKSGNASITNLPVAYLSEEVALRATDLATVIIEYVNTETPKFMIGDRPLEEVDEFWEELKSLGIEEYIEIYREAYAGYMETIFGK